MKTSMPAENDGFAAPEQMASPDVLVAAAGRRGIEVLGPPGMLP